MYLRLKEHFQRVAERLWDPEDQAACCEIWLLVMSEDKFIKYHQHICLNMSWTWATIDILTWMGKEEPIGPELYTKN